MGTARTHARNLAANWIGHGANLVAMFFLSPFIVHTLGKTEYGIWSLLTVLTGYMGLLDIGVRSSTGRFIALYLGRNDHRRIDETIRTGLGIFSAVGLIMLRGSVGLGYGFPFFFESVPPRYGDLVLALLPVLAVNLWVSGLVAVFSSVLTAHDRFDLTRGVDIIVLGVRTGGTVAALMAGYGMVGMTAAILGAHVVGLLGNWWLAKRTYPRLKIWPPAFLRRRTREMFGYGIPAFVSRIAYKIIGQTDMVIVGAVLGVAAVTPYSVGAMLVMYSASFLGHVNSTFFPTIQRAAARGEDETVRWYYFRQLRLAAIVGLPVYIGYVVFGEIFIHLWMGDETFGPASVASAGAVMAILSAAKCLHLFADPSKPVLFALGHIRYSAAVVTLEAGLNIGFSLLFILSLGWGLPGVAGGTLVAYAMTTAVLLPWKAHRVARIRWRPFMATVSRALVGGGAFGGWCLLVRYLFVPDSWPAFFSQVAIALAGYVPIALLTLVPRTDRRRLVQRLTPDRGEPEAPDGRPADAADDAAPEEPAGSRSETELPTGTHRE